MVDKMLEQMKQDELAELDMELGTTDLRIQ